MVTCDVPAALREAARPHPHPIDSIFCRPSAAALPKGAQERALLGGQRGVLGVRPTWPRDRRYHPQRHDIGAGGGRSADGSQGLPAREDVLVPVKALSKSCRAQFRAAFPKPPLDAHVPPETWAKAWGVPGKPGGSGHPALTSLAPYLLRVALSNKRILNRDDGHVACQYQDAQTGTLATRTVAGEACLRRFVPHVRPDRFIKVRDDGFLSSSTRPRLETSKELRQVKPMEKAPPTPTAAHAPDGAEAQAMRCPHCGSVMRLVGDLVPTRCRPHGARASP